MQNLASEARSIDLGRMILPTLTLVLCVTLRVDHWGRGGPETPFRTIAIFSAVGR